MQYVKKVEEIYKELGALIVIMENPGWGKSGLWGREAAAFVPKRYEIAYCQYGFPYEKKTTIATTMALPSFEPATCPKTDACNACATSLDECNHTRSVQGSSLAEKYRVPDQLINCIMRAVVTDCILPQLAQ